MHHGADGVWDVVSEEHFESYAPASLIVACCEFVLFGFTEGLPDTVRTRDEVDALPHFPVVVKPEAERKRNGVAVELVDLSGLGGLCDLRSGSGVPSRRRRIFVGVLSRDTFVRRTDIRELSLAGRRKTRLPGKQHRPYRSLEECALSMFVLEDIRLLAKRCVGNDLCLLRKLCVCREGLMLRGRSWMTKLVLGRESCCVARGE